MTHINNKNKGGCKARVFIWHIGKTVIFPQKTMKFMKNPILCLLNTPEAKGANSTSRRAVT